MMYASKRQEQIQECHDHAVSQMHAPFRWAQLRRMDLRSCSVLPVTSRAIVQLPPDECICGYLLANNIVGCFSIFKKDVTQSTRELTSLSLIIILTVNKL